MSNIQGHIPADLKLSGSLFIPKRGIDGATFTPNMDADGNLSWSNNGGLENPDTVNLVGPRGDKGDPGAIKFTIVNELPETGEDDTIYLLPSTNPQTQNAYDEFIYTNEQWEQIGQANVQVDLTDYVKTTDMDSEVKDSVVSNTIPLTAEEQAAAQSWLGGQMVKTIESNTSHNIWELENGVYYYEKQVTFYYYPEKK